MGKINKKVILVCFMIFVLLFSLAGCDSGSHINSNMKSGSEINSDGDMHIASTNKEKSWDNAVDGNDSEEVFEEQAVGDVADNNSDVSQTDRKQSDEPEKEIKAEKKKEKLVYTCNMTIQTTEYDKTVKAVNEQIKKYDGIIENQNEYDYDDGWYEIMHEKKNGTLHNNITVKIPSEKYEEFLNSLEGNGKITSKSMNVSNISTVYYDTAATIESLKIQEKRLLKMMDEAKTIDEMITVERRLTEVQTELNQYKTHLSLMDTEVEYSTVTIQIDEVLEYKEDAPGRKTNKFTQRLINTIQDSISGFLNFLESVLFFIIYLLPFALLVLFIFIISKPFHGKIKEYFDNRKKKQEERRQELRKKSMERREMQQRKMMEDKREQEKRKEEDGDKAI